MNPYSGLYGMGNRAEAILSDEEIKALNRQNGGQLPKIAGDLALAFGTVLRSVALHVGELEGQLAYTFTCPLQLTKIQTNPLGPNNTKNAGECDCIE